jgi:hypothetical protein
MNAFPRSLEHAAPNPFTPARLLWAVVHLLGIPFFHWFIRGGAAELLHLLGCKVFNSRLCEHDSDTIPIPF